MYVSKWFERELKALDSSYFITWNRHYNYFEIKKKLNIIDKDGRLKVVIPTLATFKRLNDAAMANLRYRKYMGRKFQGDTKKYLQYIKNLNRESKQKSIQLAREMQAEGFMKMHKMATSKTFDMGA